MNLKKKIKKLIPTEVWQLIRRQYYRYRIRGHVEYKQYNPVIERIRKKDSKIKAVFLATYSSCWKYDSLYKLMCEDANFEPIILVCPVVNRGNEHMLETLNECCSFFDSKGYPYICAYNENTKECVNLDNLQPDMLFYTNPYQGLIKDQYYIDNVKDVLTCFVNYGYTNVPFEWGVSLPFHNKVWKFFVECKDNYKLVKKWSWINAKNVYVSGYPMYDSYVSCKVESKDWKVKCRNVKKVIWAPHHSISNGSNMVKFSTFELHHETMRLLAEKYKDSIQFVFKPHPLLRDQLYHLDGWGKERTDSYYNWWKNNENTTFVNGDYVDLFMSSDAMIHDCASFMIEYLYTRNPVLFLANCNREEQSNECAKKAFHCHYHATSAEEIDYFLSNVVLAGNDQMKLMRDNFYNEVLLPPNGCTAADNMLNEIKKELGR